MVTDRNVQTANTSPTSSSNQPAAYFGTRMTGRQGGYKSLGADRSAGGDIHAARSRVDDIFHNRNVDLGTGARQGEGGQERIDRIAQAIVSGERTFGDVRQSVDRLAGNADHTRASAGLPAVTQPQLTPDQVGELMAARNAASSGHKQVVADATEQEARLEFGADLQRQRLIEQFDQMRKQGMRESGNAGMAFQPVGAGTQMRRYGDAQGRDVGELEARLGMDLAQLSEMVAASRRQRDTQIGAIDARQAAMQQALIQNGLAGFQG